MNDENKGTQRNEMLEKLAMFREQMQAIDAQFSNTDAYKKLQEDLAQEGKISGRKSKKRGSPRKGNSEVSQRVEHWKKYVTMLPVTPRYEKVDCNLVKFFLYKHLRVAGYSIIIQEFNYQNSMMDTFAVQGNRASEFEIKMSREDYLIDFSKLYWIGRNVNKHAVLAAGESPLISKFYFVVPENMIDVRECPDHCGLIWFKQHAASEFVRDRIDGNVVTFRVVKYPALLHSRFIPPLTWKTIAERAYTKYESIRDQYSQNIFLKTYKAVINENKEQTPVQTGDTPTDPC